MKLILKISSLLSIAVLAGCSSGTEKIDGQVAIFGEARELLRNNRSIKKSPQNAPSITRAFLDTVTVPTLAVTVENTGKTAYLLPAAIRRDTTPGRVTVWKTLQDENIVVRSGVLIGTKGLGRDLTSANATPVINSLSARKNSGGLRTLHVRNDDNGTNELRMQCEFSVVGQKKITIVEKTYDTLHFNETCQLESEEISNDYWIDSTGSMRQSRQWAGHHLGYLSMKLLKK
ncbi:MAG: YjbF family lipoprotein [Lentilitoribacter sp.]